MAKDGGFAGLLLEYERGAKPVRPPRIGDEVSATVVKIGADSVFADLGGKAEGMIDKAELTDAEGKLRVAVGERLRAFVVHIRDGQIVLGTRLGGRVQKGRGAGAEAGAELQRAFDHGIPVVGTVKGVNKGGVDVAIGAFTAFCPFSQLDLQRVQDASAYLGRQLEFLVTKLEGGRGDHPNAVLSRRALLEAERRTKAQELIAKLEIGALVRGKITRVQPFGAFVDIGGVEGLLPKSELGITRSGTLSAGTEIEVVVVKIEPSGDSNKPARISLSLQQVALVREAEHANSYQRPAAQGLATLADVLGRLKK